MGLLAFFGKWQAGRRERAIEQLTAKAVDLKEGQQYDLLFLHDNGFVRAKASGQSITQIYADVENLIRKRLRIVVTPGTYFVSSGGHQNMVTRREYTFTLAPCASQQMAIDATCINANLPIPGERDRFYGVRRVSDEVARFLVAARNSGPMVIQAGVWALTDGYTGSQVQEHLVSQDRYGNTHQAVSNFDILEARRILASLGLRNRL